MLKTKIIFLFLTLFLTSVNPQRVLFHETMTVDSLTLSEKELTDIIIKRYQINTNYKNLTIESDYFNNPKYNQLYSVTLKTNYDDEIIIYNLKIIAINKQESSVNNTPIILIISALAIIVLIIYLNIKN